MAMHNFRNCHGEVGRGGGWVDGVLSTGAEAVALSTFCSSTELSVLRRQWSAAMRSLLHDLSLFM